jgi:hypothetical protein
MYSYKNTLIAVVCFLLVWPLASVSAFIDEHPEPRVKIGLNLISSIIAANKNLSTTEPSGPLIIYLVYFNGEQLARQTEPFFNTEKKVRGHQISTRVISLSQLLDTRIKPNDAIFLVEKTDNLEPLIRYSREHQVILFSPFRGDVKKGVMAGLQITNNVLPVVNLSALKKANIGLKAFFLRIAVKHDQ